MKPTTASEDRLAADWLQSTPGLLGPLDADVHDGSALRIGAVRQWGAASLLLGEVQRLAFAHALRGNALELLEQDRDRAIEIERRLPGALEGCWREGSRRRASTFLAMSQVLRSVDAELLALLLLHEQGFRFESASGGRGQGGVDWRFRAGDTSLGVEVKSLRVDDEWIELVDLAVRAISVAPANSPPIRFHSHVLDEDRTRLRGMSRVDPQEFDRLLLGIWRMREELLAEIDLRLYGGLLPGNRAAPSSMQIDGDWSAEFSHSCGMLHLIVRNQGHEFIAFQIEQSDRPQLATANAMLRSFGGRYVPEVLDDNHLDQEIGRVVARAKSGAKQLAKKGYTGAGGLGPVGVVAVEWGCPWNWTIRADDSVGNHVSAVERRPEGGDAVVERLASTMESAVKDELGTDYACLLFRGGWTGFNAVGGPTYARLRDATSGA